MSTEIETGMFDKALAYWQFYFLATKDTQSKVWLFSPDHRWPFIQESISFGDVQFAIYLQDLFGGRTPILVNYESVTTEEIQIPFRLTAILDSNLVTYLDQFVRNQPALDVRRRRVVQDFLRFVVCNNIDFNPFYYFMEATAKNDDTALEEFARRTSASILALHTMSPSQFLSTGEIVPDPERVALYTREYQTQSMDQISVRHAKAMLRPLDFCLEWICNLNYAALLKTGLIQKKTRFGAVRKYRELQGFMEDTFNIALGVERMLALAYFAGLYGSLIPLQRGANASRTLMRCRATAWDLLLLQLPPWLLVNKIEEAIPVGFLASSDKAMNRICGACRVEAVLGMAPKVNTPLPIQSVDLSALGLPLDSDEVAEVRRLDSEWQRRRASRLHRLETRIDDIKLAQLIAELEREVTEFCDS